jgi:ABC-type polysaccharide/polyol phosphate transport system ATPase subunit
MVQDMSEIAISASGLGKRYRIGAHARQTTMRERLTHAMTAPLRWVGPGRNGNGASSGARPDFWALRDVSFELKKGEVLGLIGRNGAGKSTLLKILSRVTQPTVGRAEIRGRVGSLLEVGTGFHPELTGRENTYLNGAILGMGKKEINRKFDEIVAFAEVEEFIDTPLKHYSSGMQMRLAFAVAAHLEPEILLVDEVLAVGDINFQKKCLGKMGEVANVGRTIVFVSHQMNQIRRLCRRVIWMDDGRVRMDGGASDVLAAYESAMLSRSGAKTAQREAQCGGQFTHWELGGRPQDRCHVLSTLGPVTVNFHLDLASPLRRAVHGVALFNMERQLMWAQAVQDLDLEPGSVAFSHTFPMLPLRPGSYQWQVSLWDGREMVDLWDCIPDMNIATPGLQHYRDEWNGILNVPSNFALSTIEKEEVSR